jgi:hypothetical protein
MNSASVKKREFFFLLLDYSISRGKTHDKALLVLCAHPVSSYEKRGGGGGGLSCNLWFSPWPLIFVMGEASLNRSSTHNYTDVSLSKKRGLKVEPTGGFIDIQTVDKGKIYVQISEMVGRPSHETAWMP